VEPIVSKSARVPPPRGTGGLLRGTSNVQAPSLGIVSRSEARLSTDCLRRGRLSLKAIRPAILLALFRPDAGKSVCSASAACDPEARSNEYGLHAAIYVDRDVIVAGCRPQPVASAQLDEVSVVVVDPV